MRRRLFKIGPEMEIGRELHGPTRWLLWALVALIVMGGAGAIALNQRLSDAEVWGPAPLTAAESAVTVAGHPDRPQRGGLYIASVYERRATQLERLVPAMVAQQAPPDATLIPLSAIYGPVAPSPTQEAAQARRDLLGSEVDAEIAAYRALGYRVPVTAAGPRLPYRTRIAVDGGGPSAGLMLALALYSRLAPGNLTHGYKIAGTGTIDPNGNVGPIGGVRFKMVGARQGGARYFLVPARRFLWDGGDMSNYDEAKACHCAGAMRLVPIRSLAQAIAVLRGLH